MGEFGHLFQYFSLFFQTQNYYKNEQSIALSRGIDIESCTSALDSMKEKAEAIRKEAKLCVETKLESATEIVENIKIHVNNSLDDLGNYINESMKCVYNIEINIDENGAKRMNTSFLDLAKAAVCIEKVSITIFCFLNAP